MTRKVLFSTLLLDLQTRATTNLYKQRRETCMRELEEKHDINVCNDLPREYPVSLYAMSETSAFAKSAQAADSANY